MESTSKSSGDLSEEEINLVESLKTSCDKNGREENKEESAKILHKLGLVYKQKSPDKFSLIRSAALLNAAILRKPSNVEDIKKDLTQLHLHVFQLSKAKYHEGFDINRFTEEIREKIDLMRKETKSSLEKLKHIPDDISSEKTLELEKQKIRDVKNLQNEIVKQYSDVMKCVSDKCMEVMGKPPCRYTVAGMGSLARKEITPYSDLEHIIVLEDEMFGLYSHKSREYDAVLEHFRWYSVLFQLIIINLGETVIPSLNIPSLNNAQIPEHDWYYDVHTPNGICFDGMKMHACKFPLGRQEKTKKKPWTIELIQPITEMVKFLDTDKDLKNGYHLSDVIATTCFVAGDQSLYDEFSRKVKVRMHKNRSTKFFELITERLEKDLANFDVIEHVEELKYARSFNIKSVVYRITTLFIAWLGRMYSVDHSPCSSFDVINALKQQKMLDSQTAHELAYGISVACEIRLKIYSSKDTQDDISISPDYFDEPSRQVAFDLVKEVGKRSVVDYFIIAWKLQNMIQTKSLKFDNNNIIISVHIPYALSSYKRVIETWEQLKARNQINDFPLYVKHLVVLTFFCLRDYESALSTTRDFLKHEKTEDGKLLFTSLSMFCLTLLKRRDEEVFKSMKHMMENLTSTIVLNTMNNALTSFGKYLLLVEHDHKQALKYFIKVQENLSKQSNQEVMLRINTTYCIGRCLYKSGNITEAFEKGQEVLGIEKQNYRNMAVRADAYNLVGDCYVAKKDYVAAIRNFKTAVSIMKNMVTKPEPQLLIIEEINKKIAMCSL